MPGDLSQIQFKRELRHRCFFNICINLVKKEPSIRLCGVLINFHEVIKLQSFVLVDGVSKKVTSFTPINIHYKLIEAAYMQTLEFIANTILLYAAKAFTLSSGPLYRLLKSCLSAHK